MSLYCYYALCVLKDKAWNCESPRPPPRAQAPGSIIRLALVPESEMTTNPAENPATPVLEIPAVLPLPHRGTGLGRGGAGSLQTRSFAPVHPLLSIWAVAEYDP